MSEVIQDIIETAKGSTEAHMQLEDIRAQRAADFATRTQVKVHMLEQVAQEVPVLRTAEAHNITNRVATEEHQVVKYHEAA